MFFYSHRRLHQCCCFQQVFSIVSIFYFNFEKMQNGVKKITSAFYDVSCRLKIRASIIETIVKAETQYVETLKYIVEVGMVCEDI